MNFSCLSPGEVVSKYRHAENPDTMLQVLADLTDSSVTEMARFLGVSRPAHLKKEHTLGKSFDRKPKVKIDPEQVKKLYLDGMSDRQIAEALGCSKSPVGRIRRGLGLPTHSPQPKLDNAQVLRLYKQGLSDKEIAVQLGANRRTVAGWRHRNYLPPNVRMEAAGESL